MTQPDKWDEIAHKVWWTDEVSATATALRSAYAEGEKAGMERAAGIAEAIECEWANDREEAIQGYPVGVLVSPSAAIRAAKETKE